MTSLLSRVLGTVWSWFFPNDQAALLRDVLKAGLKVGLASLASLLAWVVVHRPGIPLDTHLGTIP